MIDNENRIDEIFQNMKETGLVSTSNDWIEKAVEQKNPLMTLGLAHSTLLNYDRLDLRLITLYRMN